MDLPIAGSKQSHLLISRLFRPGRNEKTLLFYVGCGFCGGYDATSDIPPRVPKFLDLQLLTAKVFFIRLSNVLCFGNIFAVSIPYSSSFRTKQTDSDNPGVLVLMKTAVV